ncbi:MAG: DUF4242 domain-containing protein [Alphaproteobacteria bacterium]|nr:DUF4242 domain-containing protein [Alphaproteobacteria bacterium]HPF45318.1 DUF4242 domain-containing protein [Emcibacteraceae bacterium]HRW28913.1 DUF4242 domain-containing protein [Emcibacteraceae bacterium]
MKKYMIERHIPDIGTFEHDQYKAAAAKSNEVLAQLGPEIEWVESYVAANQTYCIYNASDENIIRKHSEISGFPANKITELVTGISPETAN